MKRNRSRVWMAALVLALLISAPGAATPAWASITLYQPRQPQSEQPTPSASSTPDPNEATQQPSAESTATLEPATATPEITQTPAPATATAEDEATPSGAEAGPTPSLTPTESEQPDPALLAAAAAAATFPGRRTINAPYLSSGNIAQDRYTEMAVFWFGRINRLENYTDVRVGYNDRALVIQANVVDRLFWYDPQANPARLVKSDAVSLFLNLDDPARKTLNDRSFRFISGLNWWEDHSRYQAAFRGSAGKWKAENVPFTSYRGYAGAQFNNAKANRGWATTFEIPFESLGLSGRPADGAVWNLAVVVHDRDGSRINPAKFWPETYIGANPSSWGRLRFGMPAYTPPPSSPGGVTIIRNKLNKAVVTDAGVGGDIGNLCNAADAWTRWGSRNFRNKQTVNIQNQGYIGDWPCFSRFYIKFPLGQIPKGKVIVSAKLVMHEWGGSDFSQAQPSLIQVSTTNTAWSEATITWNNGPKALENVSQAWVSPMDHVIQPDEWPGVRVEWDVSRAAAQAYGKGVPLQLALYSADQPYHSGKYFTTSNTADWNAEGRPTLMVEWGNP